MPKDESPVDLSADKLSSPKLYVCILATSEQASLSFEQILNQEHYALTQLFSPQEFLDYIANHRDNIDCLILTKEPSWLDTLEALQSEGTLLPVVIVEPEQFNHSHQVTGSKDGADSGQESSETKKQENYLYHRAEIHLPITQESQISFYIDQAITKFLQFNPNLSLSQQLISSEEANVHGEQDFSVLQRHRLIEKLRERLGYLGVYYKRNPQQFFHNLSQQEKRELLSQLRSGYGQIILGYFSKENKINQAIDQFVNQAFFADLSVGQVVEIHMDLIDDFATQLKLEGRSEEILLDYRLTLIDVIAHLCEMYRRSIPREDTSFKPYS